MHLEILLLAGGEFERKGHVWHGLEAAALMVEYLPDMHWVHTVSPETSLKVPATHSTQRVPPSGPVNPALHLQPSWLLVVSGEFECAPHPRQTSEIAPISGEYWSAGQLVHSELPVVVL